MSNRGTNLTTTFKKATLVKLLEDRVKEVHADYERSVLEYEEKRAKIAGQQATFFRKLADRLDSGKQDPVSRYEINHGDDFKLPSTPNKPQKAYCRAESLLKQVKGSDQAHWRFDTDTYEAIFGSACKV
jgi:hypothetical protein